MPVCLDILLKPEEIIIPNNLYEYLKTFTKNQPESIKRILVPILATNPESNVLLFRTAHGSYASWTIKPRRRTATSCKPEYLLLQRDPPHQDTAGAIIAAKLIGIARHASRQDRVFNDYSAQYLLDIFHTPAEKVQPKFVVEEGLEYARQYKIPRDKDWPYVGRRNNYEARDVYRCTVTGYVDQMDLDGALICLTKNQPVAAKLHVFSPEDTLAKDGIYRGPRYMSSLYKGLEDVMVCETKVVEGELVALVKLPCSEVEYLNVSLDIMLIQEGRKIHSGRVIAPDKDLAKPTRLLRKFVALNPEKTKNQRLTRK